MLRELCDDGVSDVEEFLDRRGDLSKYPALLCRVEGSEAGTYLMVSRKGLRSDISSGIFDSTCRRAIALNSQPVDSASSIAPSNPPFTQLPILRPVPQAWYEHVIVGSIGLHAEIGLLQWLSDITSPVFTIKE